MSLLQFSNRLLEDLIAMELLEPSLPKDSALDSIGLEDSLLEVPDKLLEETSSCSFDDETESLQPDKMDRPNKTVNNDNFFINPPFPRTNKLENKKNPRF